MIIIDNTHVVVLDICKPPMQFQQDLSNLVVRYSKQIAHAFCYAPNAGDGKQKYLCLGPGNNPFLLFTEFGKLAGLVELPKNITSFVTDGNDFERNFAYLLEADLNKHQISILEFLNRPQTNSAGLRYRVFERAEIVKKAMTYTNDHVNYHIRD